MDASEPVSESRAARRAAREERRLLTFEFRLVEHPPLAQARQPLELCGAAAAPGQAQARRRLVGELLQGAPPNRLEPGERTVRGGRARR